MSSTGERMVAGRYRLRRQLGQGAMGTVWEAYDEFLHRTVAVKEVLLPPGIPDEQAAELRERTMREARAIAALSHPNVVMVHDMAREGGEPFVVMEYHAAYSLAQVLNVVGPLSVAQTAAVANAVAAGLSAAHQAGITHRDVKPGNVLIGVDGQVKLTDFGIARNVSEQTLTSTGIMLGSPAYIAPEVAAGREVTPAADLWGLGATLFAAMEGRPPYDVDGAVLDTVNQVVHGEVPKPSVDGPLAEVVAGLMVKDPENRITLRELRNKLHPLLPPPSAPLLTDDDLKLLAEPPAEPEHVAPADEPAPVDHGSDAPLAADPGPLPDGLAGSAGLAADPGPLPAELAALATDPGPAPSESAAPTTPTAAQSSNLAPAPGPLPFDTTVRHQTRRERGTGGSIALFVVALVAFLVAASAGFVLSRYLGGEPLLPPKAPPVTTTTSQPSQDSSELKNRLGSATTAKGLQGGNFSLLVPGDWVDFVEQVSYDKETLSTRAYYVSPDGSELLTIERLAGYYPAHDIKWYIDKLESAKPDVIVEPVDQQPIGGLAGPGETEGALALTYRSTADAKRIAPEDKSALNQNRVTFAHLLPYAGDLWVVSVTVPVEQEDSGAKLFEQIAPSFKVTG